MQIFLEIRPDSIGFPKMSLLMLFISFSVDSAMRPIMGNVLAT